MTGWAELVAQEKALIEASAGETWAEWKRRNNSDDWFRYCLEQTHYSRCSVTANETNSTRNKGS